MKIFTATIIAALASGIVSCSAKDTYTTDTSVLPRNAMDIVTTNYNGVKVSQIKVEHDEYEVILANGTKIDFSKDGSINNVKAGVNDTIPAGIMPQNVVAYIRSNFAGQTVAEYDVDRNKQEVELSSGLEVKFDAQGNVLKVDR